MPISLPDARQLSDEVLRALRLRAIRGCELGYTETEVADLLGLARETVSRWWSAYAGSGEQALPGDRTGRPVGSGRTLNDGQAAWLRAALVSKTPRQKLWRSWENREAAWVLSGVLSSPRTWTSPPRCGPARRSAR